MLFTYRKQAELLFAISYVAFKRQGVESISDLDADMTCMSKTFREEPGRQARLSEEPVWPGACVAAQHCHLPVRKFLVFCHLCNSACGLSVTVSA